jgi:hypothetical protein
MLKRAIKEEKMAFAHIDASSLDIWNVSIPVDGDTNLNAQVEDMKILETKPLLPVKQLSDVFRDAVKRHLHVIVLDPTSECSPDLFLSMSSNAFFLQLTNLSTTS